MKFIQRSEKDYEKMLASDITLVHLWHGNNPSPIHGPIYIFKGVSRTAKTIDDM